MKPISPAARGLPDLRWINRELSIAVVAHRLNLRFEGLVRLHCWHPERHEHGDRTASVGIRSKNNTVKCFGCGSRPMGPIDLVMDVLQFDSPGTAALWIADRFDVPRLPKGKHLVDSNRQSGRRAGFEGELGVLIQSGLWARLSPSARSIAPVFAYFADRVPGRSMAPVTISYRAITRYSGVASPNAVANAIRELCGLGWMQRDDREAVNGQVVRAANQFLLTPESDELHELAQAHAQQMKDEIRVERELRKQQRSERLQTLKAHKETLALCAATKYKTLYAENSVEQIRAIPGIARIHCEWAKLVPLISSDGVGSSGTSSFHIGAVRSCRFAVIRQKAEISGGSHVAMAVAL